MVELLQDVHSLSSHFPQLRSLFVAHNSDPHRILENEQNLKKTAESYHTLLKTRDSNRIYEQLKIFFSKAEIDPFQIFPTSEEISSELVPILKPIRDEMPYYTTNVNLSSPVGEPETSSLNVIIRLYDSAKKNVVKIKIGSFIDDAGELFWEVGFVYVFKSIRNIQQFDKSQVHSKGDYFLLQQLVDCTKKFITRRPKIAGLDLTPAYYHVLQLCRRLGGRTVGEFDWEFWRNELEAAYQYSLQNDHLRFKDLGTINKRYVISWMFENGLMRAPSGRVLQWNPPRLIWFPAGS